MIHLPRKRFGQHFLQDSMVIHRIITALNPKAEEHLIEIGPGGGALTIPILKKIKQLEVIEFDRDLVAELHQYQSLGNLVIHSADVLAFDFANVKQDARLLRIFGNLPYNISTPLIFHLLDFTTIIADMLFMLQKEVAVRLAANINTKQYSRLSVMVQYHCQVELLFDVSADAFYPPPKVCSSIVKLRPYHAYPCLAKDYSFFATIVKTAFGQRRKTLRNSLKDFINDESWERIQLPSHLRPENLTVNDFVELSNRILG
ncbi:MAG: 16S rRNA (adenine(1518)-N(6)/adenine(1519)-N(6))-dimethyltransferase [Gammaproteobacteria bacterium RIFCSPHIGHO2_12_FULL_37_14]|nr:MAG: 16S rRNA (adenine(1518)-N(6)/adenine(1519)-N(6))-dimethyltransferase [Gammaproteobacteria bacterium RIFCSPHIGHO2_12_FULL_37_14]